MQYMLIIAGIAYAVFNIITSKQLSAREMQKRFVAGQCVVGMIAANIFYAPAWALKFVRLLVLSVVK